MSITEVRHEQGLWGRHVHLDPQGTHRSSMLHSRARSRRRVPWTPRDALACPRLTSVMDRADEDDAEPWEEPSRQAGRLSSGLLGCFWV